MNANTQGNHSIASELERGISDVLVQSRAFISGIILINWSIPLMKVQEWTKMSEIPLSILLASELARIGLLGVT